MSRVGTVVPLVCAAVAVVGGFAALAIAPGTGVDAETGTSVVRVADTSATRAPWDYRSFYMTTTPTAPQPFEPERYNTYPTD